MERFSRLRWLDFSFGQCVSTSFLRDTLQTISRQSPYDWRTLLKADLDAGCLVRDRVSQMTGWKHRGYQQLTLRE